MAEPMSDARLARLNADNEPRGDHLSGLTADEVGELLDEIERSRVAEAEQRLRADQLDETLGWQYEARNAGERVHSELRAENDRLRAQLAEIGETRQEWGQKYNGGGYLTRVDSDWMRERWPVEQWAWDNTRHGGVVGKRTIIVVEDWQEIRAEDLPGERPGDQQEADRG